MRGLVVGIGVLVLAVWSVVAWVGHWLLEAVGGWGSVNADLLPVPPEWVVLVSDLLGWATGFSAAIVITIWSIGAIVILLVTLVGALLAGRLRRDQIDKARQFVRR